MSVGRVQGGGSQSEVEGGGSRNGLEGYIKYREVEVEGPEMGLRAT